MNLREKITNDFKEAFKNKNLLKKEVLSMAISTIKNREIELKARESGISDEEIINLLTRMKKQRKESLENYQKANRLDLAEKEEGEIKIIEEYLPKQIDSEEIEKILKEIIGENNFSGKNDLGKLMGASMTKLRGKASGEKIKEIAEKLLS